MIKLQVTIFDETGRYKPMSTVFQVESMEYAKEHQQEMLREGRKRIGLKRYLTVKELIDMGYTQGKMREYDLEKIARRQRIANFLREKRKEKEEKA